jgi:hypothetical protein
MEAGIRPLPCHGRGRGFESRRSRHFSSELAQHTDHWERAEKAGVGASTPSLATISFNGLANQPEISHLWSLYCPPSAWPTIRPECELGLGCMYSSPLPASRRSTHFKPLGILKSPHATMACGAPSRSSDGPPALARGRRIKRRIISCAQLGSRTYERTRTNQEVYYQPTGAKPQ